MKTISMTLDPGSIDNAINELQAYEAELDDKCQEVCEKLASMGAVSVSLGFSRAIYTGDNDFNVDVQEKDGKYIVSVSGETVLFIEFGAGILAKDQVHPQSAEFGMGIGTYPGQKHAFDEKGWYLPREKSGGHLVHTFGNPPNMPVYNTAKDLKAEISRVVTEVFA